MKVYLAGYKAKAINTAEVFTRYKIAWGGEPRVCAVMLVNGREAMVRRAVASFAVQTASARLLIFDSGQKPVYDAAVYDAAKRAVPIIYRRAPGHGGSIFGCLRNAANTLARAYGADIICHWDSDDYSHPRRIEEQVALLRDCGRPCVGYHEALFWDTRPLAIDDPRCVSAWQAVPGAPSCTPRHEAWLYSGGNPLQPIGASLCYWRPEWEKRPFAEIKAPDERWAGDCGAKGVSAIDGARIICSIHGANTTLRIPAVAIGKDWKRAPEWDAHCERTMRLV